MGHCDDISDRAMVVTVMMKVVVTRLVVVVRVVRVMPRI